MSKNQSSSKTTEKKGSAQNPSRQNGQQNKRNRSNNRGKNQRREQPGKDSSSKRVNYDNARVSRVEEDIKEGMKKDSANDITWYNRNPELVKSAASIPFAAILGLPVFNNELESQAVPGVMAIAWTPAFGTGAKPTAMNQASDSAYSFITHANSRNTSWTAPDGFVLTSAGFQVFGMIASMMRAYGTVKLYQEQDRYLPDALLSAQGFIPADFRQNLGQIWFDLNNMVEQSKQIWIPNKYPLIEKYFWMNSNVFKDAEGARAQMYLYVQNGYLQFSETAAETGSSLQLLQLDGKVFNPADRQFTWAQWKKAFQQLISALIESEDRGIIYGDILKAYGAESLYGLPAIPADYTIAIQYNAEVLMQIENVILTDYTVGRLVQKEEDLYPVPAHIGSNGVLSEASNPSAYNRDVYGTPYFGVMNIHVPEQPSPDMVMEMTRAMTLGSVASNVMTLTFATGTTEGGIPATSADLVLIPSAIGSEAYNRIYIWKYAPVTVMEVTKLTLQQEQLLQTDYPFRNFGGSKTTPPDFIKRQRQALLDIMAFDWHPFLYDMDQLPDGDEDGVNISPLDPSNLKKGQILYKPNNVYGDFDNYTTISTAELRKLHDVALFSLYGVPHI